MIYTVTFIESDYLALQTHLFKNNCEQAAYLLCGLSQTENETRLLVREVITVKEPNIEYSDSQQIRYTYESYFPVIMRAVKENLCFMLVHSHPDGYVGFSKVDDAEERKLLKFVYSRLGRGIHGSLVFNNSESFDGRIYENEHEKYQGITKIRTLGKTYKFIDSISRRDRNKNNLDIYNRNILAFGEELQILLQDLNIGVIGAGGNGSAVIEQLCRLGVGTITIVDHDSFEKTNVTRVHGSSVKDIGLPKVDIMKNMAEDIGLGTRIITVNEKLNNKVTAQKLRDCDLIFSCLDNTHFARAILNSICIFYYLPIIDMGIKFDSRNGVLYEIFGRVDVITPLTGCLFCRDVINSRMCSAEVMGEEDYLRLKAEGYAPELDNDKVQAMPYNTLIASHAVIEAIQLLTNFKGPQKYHSVYRFNSGNITNAGISSSKKDDCICNSSELLGRGDIDPFIRLNW